MTTEMVERVARALWEEADAGAPWEQLGPWARERWAQKARAAIHAIMEPTEEMLMAGDYQIKHARSHNPLLAAWRLMHRIALGEETWPL